MVEVREVGPGGWRSMRDVRLDALREAPHAFASTYEREARFCEADWQRRIANGGNYLAYLPGLDATPVGIVSGFEAQPGTTELVSLWVRPHARGRGVGQSLVEAVLGWAQAKGIDRVHLWVTETNHSAQRLYERCGFTPTGERQSLPSHPGIAEIAMARERCC